MIQQRTRGHQVHDHSIEGKNIVNINPMQNVGFSFIVSKSLNNIEPQSLLQVMLQL